MENDDDFDTPHPFDGWTEKEYHQEGFRNGIDHALEKLREILKAYEDIGTEEFEDLNSELRKQKEAEYKQAVNAVKFCIERISDS